MVEAGGEKALVLRKEDDNGRKREEKDGRCQGVKMVMIGDGKNEEEGLG